MKLVYGILLALSFNAFAAYDSSWYVSHFWSGEYPVGFSVTVPNTVIMGRLKADTDLLRNVRCEMPYLAVIHPWNLKRQRKSKITFIGFTKIVNMTAKEDFTFSDDDRRVPIKKGDQIQFIQNDAEGSFQIRIQGIEYTADQSLYDHLEPVKDDFFQEDDWVLMTCANGKRAYIFYRDLVTETGVWVAGINGAGPAVLKYGQARDLTVREAKELEAGR